MLRGVRLVGFSNGSVMSLFQAGVVSLIEPSLFTLSALIVPDQRLLLKLVVMTSCLSSRRKAEVATVLELSLGTPMLVTMRSSASISCSELLALKYRPRPLTAAWNRSSIFSEVTVEALLPDVMGFGSGHPLV